MKSVWSRCRNAPQRGGYDASRFVLEALKRDVPIWKREITDESAF